MSKPGLIIALVLAAVLSVIAYLVLKTRPEPARTAPLIGTLDIGRVRTIDIQPSSGRPAVLSLAGPGDALWILQWTAPSGATMRWPASATRVRAALRLLAALNTAPEAGAGPVAQPATRIRLTAEGGQGVQLTVSDSPLGGRTAVSAEDVPGVALGDESLAAVFAGGLDTWRDPAVFPVDVADASRVSLTGGGAELSLARVAKSWAVTKPAQVPADEPIIATTLKALGSSALLRFANEADAAPSAPGFTTPTARVLIETDRREPHAEQVLRTTLFQELTIGGPADVAGQTLLCRLAAWTVETESGNRTDHWGPAVGIIPRDALAALSTDYAVYASRVASRIPAADIALIGIESPPPAPGVLPPHGATFVREADGWKETRSGAKDPSQTETMEAIVGLVTRERASSVVTDAAGAFQPRTIIVLKGQDNSETIEAGILQVSQPPESKAQTSLALRAGPLVRLYKGDLAAKLAPYLTRN